MTTLDIHPASPAERIQIYRNVHEFWGRGLSLEEHVERRLTSVQHNRATWIAGCLDGNVVASLGCYPLQFRVHGEVVPGIAIGAVHTLPEFRGRGFAPQLFAWLEDHFQREGVKLSLLYSDIAPAYYAHLGYLRCPSFEAWIDVAPQPAVSGDATVRWDRFDAREHARPLRELEHRCRLPEPISIYRNADYWNFLLQKDGHDQFYRIVDGANAEIGYVRIGELRQATVEGKPPRLIWKIRDLALVDRSESNFRLTLHAGLAAANAAGAVRLGGWMPETDAVRGWTEPTPRNDEITMLKSLSPEITLDEATIAAVGNFQEIDHV